MATQRFREVMAEKAAKSKRIIIKTPREIDLMRRACEISALALRRAGECVVPGATTADINRAVGEFIKSKGAVPSFLGLYGYPGNACVSVNRELIHGIGSKKRYLNEGDIVSIDVGAYKDGYHGDNAWTFVCGNPEKVSDAGLRLMTTGAKALRECIAACVEGNRVGDVAHTAEKRCKGDGFFIPVSYCGHGIGRTLHEAPDIPNVGTPGKGPRLTAGMTICIEPMFNETTAETAVLSDGWTVVEANGGLSVHYEHAVLITKGEPVVLTELV